MSDEMSWREAALVLGEHLVSVGPDGYYSMSATEWLNWARLVVRGGVNSE